MNGIIMDFFFTKMQIARNRIRHAQKKCSSDTATIEKALAISPIDGRYKDMTFCLEHLFSEFALMRIRVKVEVLYLIRLLRFLHGKSFDCLKKIYHNFTMSDFLQIKEFEKTTKHDVKAVEYFLKHMIDTKYSQLKSYKQFVHFALTSQDINNTALSLSLKQYTKDVYLPCIGTVAEKLCKLSHAWKPIIMIGRTHGQPASPTSLGKELHVFVYRLNQQLCILRQVEFFSKFGGATGNLNAHYAAYPEHNWEIFCNQFLRDDLELKRSLCTTQIDSYDSVAVLCDAFRRINTILLDLVKDLWLYISFEYIQQKNAPGQIGSSTMPHKVNPIDFENAEGNLTIANALLELFSRKLPVSRLQRDLTDSTVCRNFGACFGYVQVAYQKILKGLDKLQPNHIQIHQDLLRHKVVMAEGVQTIMKKHGDSNAYEKIKHAIDTGRMSPILDQYNLQDGENYVGNATSF